MLFRFFSLPVCLQSRNTVYASTSLQFARCQHYTVLIKIQSLTEVVTL